MDIVIKGRNVEVPAHYRRHVTDKLARLERYDRKVISLDVELFHEPNPRQSKSCQRVEITVRGRGPVFRAAGRAADFYAALDAASCKLESRLRRVHDRRKVHHGRRNPTSVAEATASTAEVVAGEAAPVAVLAPERPEAVASGGPSSSAPIMTNGRPSAAATATLAPAPGQAHPRPAVRVPVQRLGEDAEAGPGRIVREQEHPAKPMTVDEALSEMELAGHDFYLFADASNGMPSVVYRRHGFDYGVVRLV